LLDTGQPGFSLARLNQMERRVETGVASTPLAPNQALAAARRFDTCH
jgi:hypothetical protein